MAMERGRFLFLLGATVALAFLLREWFVLSSIFPNVEQGDSSSYIRYALHLFWDGTFSQAGNVHPVPADAFRGPGYPIALAAVLLAAGSEHWYSAIFQFQALISTATVLTLVGLARQFLSRESSLVAGFLLAIQPHSIAATGAILVESLFGFTLMVGLLMLALAIRKRSIGWSISAGAMFGFAYLVNPVIELFPLLLLPWLWHRGLRRHALVMFAVFALSVAGWSARNAAQHLHGDDRALMNLVQGSWPSYHSAWKYHLASPDAARDLATINSEIKSMSSGDLRPLTRRLAANPFRYFRWYVLEKPYLLWDWSVRIGAGGIYTIDVIHSPLDRGLKPLVDLQRWLNPCLFLLALAGILVAIRDEAAIVAILAVYLTAVHAIFQAEPRYSISYRGLEILLAVMAAAALTDWLRHRRLLDGSAESRPGETSLDPFSPARTLLPSP